MVVMSLTESERRDYDCDGYVVRSDVFSPNEIADIARACEALIAELVADRNARRHRVGSYVFDPDLTRGTMIKWEGDSDVVHGIEPFAHLCNELNACAMDARLIDPVRELLPTETPVLFTEKLNLKRPKLGGANPLHQDYPYWVDVAEVPEEVTTAMVFLDDTTIANGCLHVVPGSHRLGKWQTRTDGDAFLANEIDREAYPDVVPEPLEASAGTVVFFGPFLAHTSAPNTSTSERRALLYSYQPPGRRHMLDVLRRLDAS